MHTGVTLDPIAVGTARKEELLFAEGLDAWEMKPRSHAMRQMGRALCGTRWLDHNKGDTSKPEYRSRHVVQKTRITSTIPRGDVAEHNLWKWSGFFSLAMSMPGMVLQCLDVWRAHAHCKVLRDNVYMEGPKELGLDTSQCWRLKRCWCGTRDAGQAFEFAVRETTSKSTTSHKERTLCTATATWDW